MEHTPLPLRDCRFITERMVVQYWRPVLGISESKQQFSRSVANLLTPTVTRELPPAFQMVRDATSAWHWLEQMDQTSYLLAISHRDEETLLGFLLLSMPTGQPAGATVDFGYLLGEPYWRQGLGSELIGGFLRWCRQHGHISLVRGRVSRHNPASSRLLEKHGFIAIDSDANGMVHWELSLIM